MSTSPPTSAITARPSPTATPLLAPENPDPAVQAIIERYLDRLDAQGFDRAAQGVWVQTGDRLLAEWQGTIALPAASVTKIATTIAALQRLGADHRFETQFATTGTVTDGVLNGDLVVIGGRDPMFVWQDAIAIGNALNQQGIRQITGDLVVVGEFFMNFETDRDLAANLLTVGLDARQWPEEARSEHTTLPPGTPQPQVERMGNVRRIGSPPDAVTPLLRYESRPLAELLDQMNRYSNNMLAQTLADSASSPEPTGAVLESEVMKATGIDPGEIQLINGSGLGRKNQISARAAVAMFLAINPMLANDRLTVADVVAIADKDPGILQHRPLPANAVLKSGSLDGVSTIAGGIPTAQGVIWLAIMNAGDDTDALRSAQEALIRELEAYGGIPGEVLPELKPTPGRDLSPRLTILR